MNKERAAGIITRPGACVLGAKQVIVLCVGNNIFIFVGKFGMRVTTTQ